MAGSALVHCGAGCNSLSCGIELDGELSGSDGLLSLVRILSMAGMLIGGAAIPMIAPIAMMAPAFSLGIPIRRRTGATRAPALRTAAVDEPVIIPGNMMTSIRRMSIRAGTL